MPNKNAVIWLNNPQEIKSKILDVINNQQANLQLTKEWFETINKSPFEKASIRIWIAINSIITKCT